MVNVKGELLNFKTEWHQPKIVRTTIHTGGAELAGGRIISFPLAGSQSTQGSRSLPHLQPRDDGQGSASEQPVGEAPRRSARIRNG